MVPALCLDHLPGAQVSKGQALPPPHPHCGVDGVQGCETSGLHLHFPLWGGTKIGQTRAKGSD